MNDPYAEMALDAVLPKQINAESGGNPDAVSPKGARGPMQLMPGTAKDLGVDPDDPKQNVEGGRRYMGQLYDKYKNMRTALIAYNWGPGNVDKYGPDAAPPESHKYADKVLGLDTPAAKEDPYAAMAKEVKVKADDSKHDASEYDPEGGAYSDAPPGTKWSGKSLIKDPDALPAESALKDETPKSLSSRIIGALGGGVSAVGRGIVGAGETALHAASLAPATGAMVGEGANALGNIAIGKVFGNMTPEEEARQRARPGEAASRFMYEPRTEAGKAGAEAFDKGVEALGPMALGVSVPVAQTAGRAAGTAERAAGTAIVRAAAKPFKNLTPEAAESAQLMADKGLTPNLASLYQRPGAGAVGNIIESVPTTGGSHKANKVALNQELARLIGAETEGDFLTPKTHGAALAKSGKIIGGIYDKVEFPATAILPKIEEIKARLPSTEVADVGNTVTREIEKIERRFADNNGTLPPALAHEITSDLRTMAAKQAIDTPGLRIQEALDAIRDVFVDHVKGNLSGDDLAAFNTANKQYAIAMTIEPIVGTGKLSGVELREFADHMVRSRKGKAAMARNADLELTQLAKGVINFFPEDRGLREALGSGAPLASHVIVYGGLGGASVYSVPGGAALWGAANLYNRVGPKVAREVIRRSLPKALETPGAAAKEPKKTFTLKDGIEP